MRVESLLRCRPSRLITRAAASAIASLAVFALAIIMAVIGVGATLAMVLPPGLPFRW